MCKADMQTANLRKLKFQNLAVSAVSVLLFGIIIAKFCVINAATDERQIMMLLSDELESDIFMVHLQSQFALFIKALYRLFPSLEIYSLLVWGSTLFTQFILIYAVLDRAGKHPIKTRISAFVFSFLLSCFAFTKFLLTAKYTHAAILLMVGVFLYVLIKENLTVFSLVLIFFMSAFASGFRWLGAAMLLPFVLIVAVYKFILNKNDKKTAKMYALAALTAVVVILGSNALNSVLYANSEYKDLLKVDKLRSSIQDYRGLPSYEKFSEAYDEIGLSPERVKLIRHAQWGIADVTDVETLEKLNEIRDEYYSYLTFPDKLKEGFDTFREALSETMPVYGICAVVFSVLALILSVRKRDKLGVLFIVSVLLTVFLEVFYLCYKGRMPFRVFFPLELLPILVSSLFIVKDMALNIDLGVLKSLFSVVFAAVFVFGTAQTIYKSEKNYAFWQSKADLTEQIENTSGTLYLHISSMAASRVSFIHENKNYFTYINAGGNISEMPYWKKLVKGEYSSVSEALSKREDIRFVSASDNREVQNIVDYLNQEGYSVSADFEEITVDGEKYRIWKINNGK